MSLQRPSPRVGSDSCHDPALELQRGKRITAISIRHNSPDGTLRIQTRRVSKGSRHFHFNSSLCVDLLIRTTYCRCIVNDSSELYRSRWDYETQYCSFLSKTAGPRILTYLICSFTNDRLALVGSLVSRLYGDPSQYKRD